MSSTELPGASVSVYRGLCKLTLTAPCCHLLELLENTLTYVCFTWDNILKSMQERKDITVVRCIKLDTDFKAQLFSPVVVNTRCRLPTDIFQFYATDPSEDERLITMASIFSYCSASKLDCVLAAGVEQNILTSVSFSENFYYHALLSGKMWSYSNEYTDCDKLILIQLVSPKDEVVPLQWAYMLQGLLWKRLQLLDVMNWLNTLGGGYSALGDYFEVHAVKAAEISSVQLRVALEMGDPPTVIRCYLYFALSLMQRGHLRKSKYMLRYLYRCALRFRHTDQRLVNMCLGVWSRLRYFYSIKHKKRRHSTNTNGLTAIKASQKACQDSDNKVI